jgi:hypothetical protein
MTVPPLAVNEGCGAVDFAANVVSTSGELSSIRIVSGGTVPAVSVPETDERVVRNRVRMVVGRSRCIGDKCVLVLIADSLAEPSLRFFGRRIPSSESYSETYKLNF